MASHYPNYELANRLSRDYGIVGGFGRDFGIGGDQADQYYWLDSSAWLDSVQLIDTQSMVK